MSTTTYVFMEKYEKYLTGNVTYLEVLELLGCSSMSIT